MILPNLTSCGSQSVCPTFSSQSISFSSHQSLIPSSLVFQTGSQSCSKLKKSIPWASWRMLKTALGSPLATNRFWPNLAKVSSRSWRHSNRNWNRLNPHNLVPALSPSKMKIGRKTFGLELNEIYIILIIIVQILFIAVNFVYILT